MPPYTKKLRSVLSPAESQLFAALHSPHKIQDYLDTLRINFDTTGDLLSPRRVMSEGKAQCIEGAMFAAASLAYHGHRPLLLDFQTIAEDEDHVIALFQHHGLWGAISKTNHGILRWRDPLYTTVRELAMSYFHEYYMHDGRKSLRTFSKPFDMRRYDPSWAIAEVSLDWVAQDLDDSVHTTIVPHSSMRSLRKASQIELKLLDVVEWKRPKK